MSHGSVAVRPSTASTVVVDTARTEEEKNCQLVGRENLLNWLILREMAHHDGWCSFVMQNILCHKKWTVHPGRHASRMGGRRRHSLFAWQSITSWWGIEICVTNDASAVVTLGKCDRKSIMNPVLGKGLMLTDELCRGSGNFAESAAMCCKCLIL